MIWEILLLLYGNSNDLGVSAEIGLAAFGDRSTNLKLVSLAAFQAVLGEGRAAVGNGLDDDF